MKRSLILMAAGLLLAAVAVAGVPTPLSGKVVLLKGGAPVPQALVNFISPAHKARAVTVDDGSYYVPDLPDGLYDVTISYRGKSFSFKQVRPRQNPRFVIAG